ncbi:MAG: DUF58 domain-containing protein [Bdellovibrionales bacterium]|nr:DUF58 domain-containing protein [Bdellovibrionales bacterium]
MYEVLEPANLKQLELLKLKSQRRFLGSRQGGNVSLKRGHGMEFADYRRYELGDDPRYIDWGVYGRTERLYVKQFQEEQDITVFCVLDSTASMHHPEGDRKIRRATEVALGMLYVALSHHDRVHITIPGHTALGPSSGAGFIHRIAELCSNLPMIAPDDHKRGLQRFLHSVEYPGICLYISDFFLPIGEFQAQLEALYTHNLDVIAIRVTGDHDHDPSISGDRALFIDSETGTELPLQWSASMAREYAFRFAEHERVLREVTAKYQMHFFSHRASDPLMEFFCRKLAGTGVLRS